MRAVFVVDAPRRRGAEVFSWQLAAWLRRRGHAVRTAYLHAGDELPLHDDDVVLGAAPSHPVERVAVHPRTLLALRRAVEAWDADVVQVNGARTVKYGAALRATTLRARFRLVYRNIGVPSFWVRGRLRRFVYRDLVMPRMDGVVAVSDATLADVRAFYGLRCPHVAIPNGVDVDALVVDEPRAAVRARLDTPEDASVVVFVGALSPEKRPERVLDVADATGAFAWFVGDGPLRASLQARARAAPSAGRVRFLGRLSRVASVVAAADVLVCPSDTEGIPGAVLEAAWLQVPTVAFDVGGLRECVGPSTGILCPPGDTATLAAATQRLLADPERRRRLGAAAHAAVRARFALDVVGARYEAFWRSLGVHG